MKTTLIPILFFIIACSAPRNKKEITLIQEIDSLNIEDEIKSHNIYSLKFEIAEKSDSVKITRDKIPEQIVQKLVSNFYKGLPSQFTRKSRLIVYEIHNYKTINDWGIYVIDYGSQKEHYDIIIGCYKNGENYILKDAFDDYCARKKIKSVKPHQSDLEVIIDEIYSCVDEQEEHYKNVYYIKNGNMTSERILTSDESVSEEPH